MRRVGPPRALLPVLAAGAAVAWSWHRVRSTRAAAEAYREQGRLEERGQVARDVHDTVAQGLTAITMLVRAAELALARADDGASVRERLAAIRAVAALSLGQSQDLVHGVAYSELAAGGLEPAARTLVALTTRTLEAGADLQAEAETEADGRWPAGAGRWRRPELALRTTGEPRRLELAVESAMLRMIQESTSNAVRHAGAADVVVELAFLADRVRVTVTDDGAGLPGALGPDGANGAGVGLGLAALSGRVRGLGGRLLVESGPGAGTAITAEFTDRDGAVGPGGRRRRA
ncbi:sensor histidine kinase [Kitasatospora sp. NPDC057015]|uniref:sensor histidine kinase n=1 Tax=Kitasatospora sp. NPDC057015 TaxID=3346001 RepID=UPI003630E768